MSNTPSIIDNLTAEPGLQTKLKEIAAALESGWRGIDDIGLLTGRSGIALYFFYYAQHTGNTRFADLGYEIIESVMDTVDSQEVGHGLCSGLAGFGWTMAHLWNRGFIQDEPGELLDELDDFLADAMRGFFNRYYWDYLHGALGCGLYFLERQKNGGESPERYVAMMIDILDKTAEKRGRNDIRWASMINNITMVTGYNLSLSHGMSSIVAILARALEAKIKTEKASVLLTGAVEYILAQTGSPERYGSYLPSWVCPEEPSPYSRLAWCYGDLGSGIALLRAARITGNTKWETRAMDILEHSATRKDPKKEGVADAGLCHGAAGMAHCFRHLYRHTGRTVFDRTAGYWLKYTLKKSCHSDGPAGYKSFQQKGWVDEYGILNGIAGIGLTIMSELSGAEPTWDAGLLLS